MTDLELSRPMRILVEDISGIGPGDETVILTDDTRLDIARALGSALRSAGATTAVTIIPYEDQGGVEPPAMAEAIMQRADYAFLLTSNNITHTDAHRSAQAAGTQIASMWGISEDTFLRGPSPENYEEVDRVIRLLKDKLQDIDQITVTSDAGTDISFGVTDRPVLSLGIFENDKSSAADFPQGEVAIAPVEGTANGTVMVDVGMDILGLVETPIELKFEDGHVQSIRGDTEATELQRLIDGADENATNLAEFAIGANGDARLVDHIRETKKKLGTVHFAIGDSNTIGGTVTSDIHLDGIVANPTIKADGATIMKSGQLKI